MIARGLTQLIAANQVAGAAWVVLATIIFGAPPVASVEGVLGVAIGVVTIAAGFKALRGARAGTMALAVVLLLQAIEFANTSLAWQLCLGANWRITFQPTLDWTDLGFEGLFSTTAWPPGGGSLLAVNVTALLAGAYLLIRWYRKPPEHESDAATGRTA